MSENILIFISEPSKGLIIMSGMFVYILQGTLSVMVTIVRNGINDQSSSTRWGCLDITSHNALGKGINPSFLPPSQPYMG